MENAEQVATEISTTTEQVEIPQADTSTAKVGDDVVEVKSEESPVVDNSDGAKKKKTAQDRINHLTWEKYERDRKITELEKQIAASLIEKDSQSSAGLPKEVITEPKEEDYNIYTEYLHAKTVFEARREASEVAQKLIKDNVLKLVKHELNQVEVEKKVEEHDNLRLSFEQKSLTAGVEKHEDFMEVAYNSDIPYTALMQEQVLKMGDIDIAYFIGKNPYEAWRLAQIKNPSQLAKEFTILKNKLNQKPTITNAPPPISPTKGLGGKIKGDASKMTPEEWITNREAEIERRRSLGG